MQDPRGGKEGLIYFKIFFKVVFIFEVIFILEVVLIFEVLFIF